MKRLQRCVLHHILRVGGVAREPARKAVRVRKVRQEDGGKARPIDLTGHA
ncbi:MAG: hypothetical protein NVSMB26_03390 [Beijerinckiaceae bacterium]